MIRIVFADTEFGNALVAEHLDLWCQPSDQDVDDIASRKAFVEGFYGLQRLYGMFTGLCPFFRMETVVTDAAVLRGILLAKIAHQHLTTADTAFGKADHFIDELRTHLAFAEGLILHQVLQLGDILVRII